MNEEVKLMERIQRPEYLDFLIRSRDKQIIKVLSGVRRCGKSTLFEIYRDYLLGNGVNENQIIFVNFEDIEYEDLTDYKQLYNYVKNRLLPERINYVDRKSTRLNSSHANISYA